MAKKKPKKKPAPRASRRRSRPEHELFDPAPVDGKHMLRALSYAFRVCPKADELSRMAHAVFIDRRIICSDGLSWHVGYLPPEAALGQPLVVARNSIHELKLALEYALRVANRHSAQFMVKMGAAGVVTIDYGARSPIEHNLALCEVGDVPTSWEEPVDEAEAERVAMMDSFPSENFSRALVWYRSWDHDKGAFSIRSKGEGMPVRLDVTSNGERVATAFLLPNGYPRAYLVPNEPLFEKLKTGRRVGQSILDLQINPDGEPQPPPREKDENGDDDEAEDLEEAAAE